MLRTERSGVLQKGSFCCPLIQAWGDFSLIFTGEKLVELQQVKAQKCRSSPGVLNSPLPAPSLQQFTRYSSYPGLGFHRRSCAGISTLARCNSLCPPVCLSTSQGPGLSFDPTVSGSSKESCQFSRLFSLLLWLCWSGDFQPPHVLSGKLEVHRHADLYLRPKNRKQTLTGTSLHTAPKTAGGNWGLGDRCIQSRD